MKEIFLTVSNANSGTRLDKFLADSEADLSRAYAVKLIEDGLVLVNKKPQKAKYAVREGDVVWVSIPQPAVLDIVGQDIPLDIVYEDSDLIVINKPKGMVVHPAAGNYTGTLVNALMHHCGDRLSQINGVVRPGIVHRIDKNTSGLLVVAKSDKAHVGLAQQIKEHTVERQYVAIVHDNIKNDGGTVDAPIARHHSNRKKMTVTLQNGKSAITHYSVLERFGKVTYIECRLETGRTHQIRVHMDYIGHSVLGDDVYGNRQDKRQDGQVLHAKVLGFTHPSTGERMRFEASLPEYFENLLNYFRKKYGQS